jgi:hypothetical protein
MSESKKNTRTNSGAGISYDIPVEGSLGLLALGAVGIIKWRKVRNAHNKRKLEEEKND